MTSLKLADCFSLAINTPGRVIIDRDVKSDRTK